MTTDNKISALRKLMKNNSIDAYIIPSTDPHMSEYAAEFWESRKWISGFNGSAGTVVVTLKEAGLWTDGRYYLQGEQQLSGSEIKLFKQGMSGVLDFDKWLVSVLNKNDVVGVDSSVYSVTAYNSLKSVLEENSLNINGDHDFIKDVWADRPSLPDTQAYIVDENYTGESITSKIERIRSEFNVKEVNSHLVATLDDIAWILNIRGADVAYNPVTVSYILMESDKTTLFIDRNKLDEDTTATLENSNILVKNYKALQAYIERNLSGTSCLIDPNRINQKVLSWIEKDNSIVESTNPSTFFKAIKNNTEIECVRNAMRKDGVAMSKFLCWVDKEVASGKITEVGISDKLIELRKEQKDFVGESFPTIAGYKGNGAIIHYSATDESSKTLKPSGLVLVDSGAQYFDGTTDLTRTIALGELTEEEKRDYTLVLRGHIQLAMARFPEGTRGSQLDTLARQPLLREGKNYFHGTGHGVGFFLNVHEGPHSIRPDENPNPIEIGSITSNEPGMYRANKHGIRIENLVVANLWQETDFGKFIEFETVTLAPIDVRPILSDLLLEEEKTWLNNYHHQVLDKVSPSLEGEELEWLKHATRSI